MAKKQEIKEDRSEYNCPDCKGEGLLVDVLCGKCQGTGKIEGMGGNGYADGTVQLRPNEGSFVSKKGKWVKQELDK